MTAALTLGKLRGLQQLSNPAGRLTITALDHRGSLRRAINPDQPGDVSFEAMVAFKRQLAEALVPHSSAILLDPVFGAAPLLAAGVVGRSGLLVSLEKTGYSDESGDRVTSVQPGWGVDKIKAMGASAVKLLLYYNPGSATAAAQEDVVRRAADACRAHDIPFLLEPMTYHLAGGPRKGSAEFAERLPGMVAETARRLMPLGVDVLKAEFPADIDHETSEEAMLDHCRALTDAAAGHPWVLLSAGVAYDKFKRQVEIACAAGASGFLAGRAIWQEVPGLPEGERDAFLANESARRLDELTATANATGTPWTEAMKDAVAAVDVAAGWEQRYMSAT